MKISPIIIAATLIGFSFPLSALEMNTLTCNGEKNPLGIDRPPALSWILQSSEYGQCQTAYRLQISSSPDGLKNERADVFDSGKKVTSQSIFVKPDIKLKSGVRYYWRVCVWDREEQVSGWSEPAWFETGLLHRSDWQAGWMSTPPLFDWQVVDARRKQIPKDAPPELPEPAPLFRKEFFVGKDIRNARAYICGLGYHELYINGEKAGDFLLDPAFTRYDKRALYVTHDVTELLQKGGNAVGVMLGNGWYNLSSRGVWGFDYAAWRDRPAVICQIKIDFTDGSDTTIVSDRSWTCAPGPIIFNSIRQGEWYDARREYPGWNTAGFNDAGWFPVRGVRGPEGMLSAQNNPSVKIHQSFKSKTITRIDTEHYLVDFGQNMAGFVELDATGDAGREVRLVYAEKIKDGRADQSNIDGLVASKPFQTDRYIFKGEGREKWHARFTYHGFQYVEVSGFPGRLTEENLTAHAISTGFEQHGSFKCSNQLINQIQHNTLWSYRNNFVGYPTDCPQREKNGWTGDAQLAAEAGLYNFSSLSAYKKWMQDIADEQRPSGEIAAIIPTAGWGYYWGNGPAWDSAFILIPWYLYLYTGDLSAIADFYDQMKRYVDFLTREKAENGIVSWGLGDWVFEKTETPAAITSTAYYYVDAQLISCFAKLLDKTEDAEKYADLAASIRKTFLSAFVNTETGSVGNNSQTALGCALFQMMINDNQRDIFVRTLLEKIRANDGKLDFGILGAKYVLNALANSGHADAAYRLVYHTGYPGWGHWIQQGATTLWEDWKGASSRNHIMFGDVSAWFYKNLGGIEPDPENPGFKHFYIQPFFPEDMEWAEAKVQSPYGTIRSQWRRDGGTVVLDITVPANSSATVRLQAKDEKNVVINEKGKAHTKLIDSGAGIMTFHVEPGEYCFQIKSR
ncbi:glycoside hydrolase family 78 protein [candidate division KSB1 bacterium]|nr:glycoside hydrolase family 78 protein [candidate division KSB1 bacterium]